MSLERDPGNRNISTDVPSPLEEGSPIPGEKVENVETVDVSPSPEKGGLEREKTIEDQNEAIKEHIIEYLDDLTPEKILEEHKASIRQRIEKFLVHFLRDREYRHRVNASLPQPEELAAINQEEVIMLRNLRQLEDELDRSKETHRALGGEKQELYQGISGLRSGGGYEDRKQEIEKLRSTATVWDRFLDAITQGGHLYSKLLDVDRERESRLEEQIKDKDIQEITAIQKESELLLKTSAIENRKGYAELNRSGTEGKPLVECNQVLLTRARDVEHYKGERKLSDFISVLEQSQVDLPGLYREEVEREIQKDDDQQIDGFGTTDFEAVDRFQLEKSIVEMFWDIGREYSLQWPEYAEIFEEIIQERMKEIRTGLLAYRELNKQFSSLWLWHGSKNMKKVIESGGLKNKVGHGQVLRAWDSHIQTSTTEEQDAPVYFHPISLREGAVPIMNYGGTEERHDSFTERTSILLYLPELMAEGKTNLRFLTREHSRGDMDIRDQLWSQIGYLNKRNYDPNAHEMTLHASPADAVYAVSAKDRAAGEIPIKPGTKGWYIVATGNSVSEKVIQILEETGFPRSEAKEKIIVAPLEQRGHRGELPVEELRKRSTTYPHLRIRYYDSRHDRERGGSEFYYYYDGKNNRALI